MDLSRRNCKVCGAELTATRGFYGGGLSTCDATCKRARRNHVSRERQGRIDIAQTATAARQREDYEQVLRAALFIRLEERFYNQPAIIEARMST